MVRTHTTEIIHKEKSGEHAWLLRVRLDALEYEVELDEAYWRELSGGFCSPDELVKIAFDFLLHRESRDDILPKFNMRLIQKYFPSFEEDMKRKILQQYHA
jgi:hypothetical protein